MIDWNKIFTTVQDSIKPPDYNHTTKFDSQRDEEDARRLYENHTFPFVHVGDTVKSKNTGHRGRITRFVNTTRVNPDTLEETQYISPVFHDEETGLDYEWLPETTLPTVPITGHRKNVAKDLDKVMATSLALPFLAYGAGTLASTIASSVAANPQLWAQALQRTAAGMIGYEGVNEANKLINNGETWGQTASRVLHIPEWAGDLSNPGGFLEGVITNGGNKVLNIVNSGINRIFNTSKQSIVNPSIIRTVGPTGKIQLSLPSHTKSNPRQFILDPQGNNKFYVHMKTWDGDHIPANLTNEEKQTLFQALYDELPDGAEILLPLSSDKYLATRGTIAGLQRLARDSRFTPGTPGIVKYVDKDKKTIRIYNGTSFIKTPRQQGVIIGKLNGIDSHLQGDSAVQMFKEYGGDPIPENSINGQQLRQYVPEVRERYGLTGNTEITDEEIAQALYKHVKELGGNTQALNAQGEPQLLFRADTKRYTQLQPRVSPEELAQMNGTMDNSLGTLFLGELPFTDGGDVGVMKYLNTGAYAYSKDGKLLAANWRPSQTGGSSIKIGDKVYRNWRDAPNLNTEPSIANIPEGAVLIDSGTPTPSGLVTKKYKLPVSLTEAEAQDINGFVVRTPSTHYMTDEMQVLAQPEAVNPESPVGKLFNWLTEEKPTFFYKDGEFPTIMYKGKEYPALANSPEVRELWRDQYRQLLNNAENEGSGLLISESTNGWLRREHPGYTYFALPNFNIKGAKHILPYDLRIPRDWTNSNIYKFGQPTSRTDTPTYLYNPLETRLNRLQNRDVYPSRILYQQDVQPEQIRDVAKQIQPDLTEDQLDQVVQMLMANKRGSYLSFGDDLGNTTSGIGVVDVEDAIKYLKESGISNPTKADIETVVGHEAGHGVKVSEEALNAVRDYYAPDEFYTQAGQILDSFGITDTSNPVPFNQFMDMINTYLKSGHLDNGISKLRTFMNSLSPVDRQKVMKHINRFSATLPVMLAIRQMYNGKTQ